MIKAITRLTRLALFSTVVLTGWQATAQNFIVGSRGTVLRSDNQGRNWRALPSGMAATGEVQTVHVIQDTVLIGGLSQIRRSTDGGKTWNQVFNANNSMQYRIFNFPNGTTYSLATAGTNNNRSLNFGQTWAGNSNGPGTAPFTDGRTMAGTSTGFVLADGGRTLRRTTNNGTNWATAFTLENILVAKRIHDTTIIAATNQGQVVLSNNSGQTWTDIVMPGIGTRSVRTIAVSPSQDTLVAAGTAGYLARSTDRGRTWTQITLNAVSAFNRAVFRTADTVFVVGDVDQTGVATGKMGRNMWRSTDAGATFSRISVDSFFVVVPTTAVPRNLQDISFVPGTQVAYASLSHRTNNNENVIIKTTNGGNTWFTTQVPPVSSRIASALIALSVDTIITGFNGAYSGEVWWTTDGGNTWSRRFQEGANTGKRQFYQDGQTLYLVGASGILRSTNRGQNWTKLPFNFDAYTVDRGLVGGAGGQLFSTADWVSFNSLNPLGFSAGFLRAIGTRAGSDEVYLAGDRGAIYRSIDQGITFDYIGDTARRESIRAIAFPTSAKGFGVTDKGNVYSTIDSGQTWTTATISNYRLNDIEFRSQAFGMIVGDSGVAYTTVDTGATWTRIYPGTRQNLNQVYFGSAKDSNIVHSLAVRVDTAINYATVPTDIPVRVRNFRNISSLQGSISWPAGKATYNGVVGINLPGMLARNFRMVGNSVQFNWSTATQGGISLPDSAVIFTLRITALDTANALVPLRLSGGNWLLGATDSSATSINAAGINGYIRVAPAPKIATGTPNSATYCAGDTIRLPFTVTGGDFTQGNRFYVLFSKPNGTFPGAIDTARGNLISTTSGTVVAVLPDTMSTSSNYRVIVAASLPLAVGDTSATVLTINARPARPTITAATAAGNVNICPGDSTLFSAPAGFASYLWSNGATTQTTWMKAAGTYTVRVANAAGCLSTASLSRTVGLLPAPGAPTVSVTASKITFCQGDSTQLNGPTAVAYRWSNGATTRQIWVKDAGTYRLQIRTSATGCFSTPSAPVNITVNTVPATASITQVTADSLLADVAGGTSYVWQRNGVTITGQNTQKIFISQSGNYTVRVVVAGCTSTVSGVYVNNKPWVAKDDLNIYPNPAQNYADLLMSNVPAGQLVYSLVDATGRIVLTGEAKADQGMVNARLNLEGLAQGIYVLQLSSGTQRLNTRLVIQK